MKQNNNYLLRVITFCLIGVLLLFAIQYILTPKWFNPENEDAQYAREFYNLDKETLDVLFLGNSHLYYGVSPLKIYDEQKTVSFVIGSANQRMPISYLFLKQALLTQKPKVVVLEISSLLNEYTMQELPWTRAASFLRSPKLMLECTEIYGELTATMEQGNKIEAMKAFAVPIYRYHSRWPDLNSYDFRVFCVQSCEDKRQSEPD